jgi:type IV secretory pathway VirJ component
MDTLACFLARSFIYSVRIDESKMQQVKQAVALETSRGFGGYGTEDSERACPPIARQAMHLSMAD